ncbi:MAG: D-3-phosphoglycerate dehydrogenase [Alphaproteobacteria bacterium MarineAlpha2_Bin1]|nr:MAG: D-3-phosphoglycerate dehydrogenase [Alphaproteobacteria bacterium MarineAlpha2_Bin1]
MVKVLISDTLSFHAKEIFLSKGIEVDVKTNLSEENLIKEIKIYDALVVRSNTKVNKKIIESARKLKVVGRAGTGADNIDIKAASKQGIIVMNTPFGNSITTAEHAIALMFSLARRIPQASKSTHSGKWEKSKFMGSELFGKTLGLIGCGRIGSIVANRAIGLKIKVVAFDPFLSHESAKEIGVTKVEFDELLSTSDYISLHTPLTETTKNIINKESIDKMKKGVCIINCARGGLIDERDLLKELNNGKVSGAALDVFTDEPAHENILFGHDNVIATPHLGASTLEAQENVSIQVAEQISDYLLEGSIENALNMPSISREDAPKIKPFLELVRQISSFLGQLTDFEVKKFIIEFNGEVASLNVHPLTSVALEGVFKYGMDSINMVNAPSIIRDRGVEIIETINEKSQQYRSTIKLVVEGDRIKKSVEGVVFENGMPRVIDVNGIRIEAELTNNMLLITNDDQPGFVGFLGGILGGAGINIATLQLGRQKPGGKAVSLISVDGPIDINTLNEIKSLSLVNSAISINFN